MTVNSAHLDIGAIAAVNAIRLVHPYWIRSDTRRYFIVAEARLAGDPSAPAPDDTRRGLVPIDELSTFVDFDPSTANRPLHVKRRMCEAILRDADATLQVIDFAGADPVLSVKRRRRALLSVIRMDHRPQYEMRGFNHLENLFQHLLKHPLGLGGAADRWTGDYEILRHRTLARLRAERCPGALNYDGSTRRLNAGDNPCGACPVEQKIRCFDVLAPLRKRYEHDAAACAAAASDRLTPRHYHYEVPGSRGEPRQVIVFMDAECRKVVAKRHQQSSFAIATFFFQDDCNPRMTDDEGRYENERHRMRALVAGSPRARICVPPSFGF